MTAVLDIIGAWLPWGILAGCAVAYLHELVTP